jgi:nitrite reductase/ring-hydroxylating ferredoxin subunit
MRGVTVGGTRLVVVNVEGRFCAFEDRCPHQGLALSAGRLEGHVLTCPAHEWEYDVTTGAGVNPRGARLRRFPVKLDGADVCVDLDRTAMTRDADQVGPVLQVGAASDGVLRALLEDNPGASVVERGGYVRVLVPHRCQLKRATVERHTGASFRLPGDLEMVMSSFKGRLSVGEDVVVWELGRDAGRVSGGGPT